MTDAQLRKLCEGWRKAAKWYRSPGFSLNTEAAQQYRQAKAEAFTLCAKELSAELRKAKK